MIETPAHTHRTPAEVRRRRALHNAAAGHTTVVLYACTEDEHTTPVKAVAALRTYAAARDWDVAEIILDGSHLATPLDRREQWIAVRDAITDRRAEGVVTLQGHAYDAAAPMPEALTQWLAEHGAFIAVAHVAPRAPQAERTTT